MKEIKIRLAIAIIVGLAAIAILIGYTEKQTTLYDLPDNVYEGIVLSHGGCATEREILDFYKANKEAYDTLSFDEVLVL